MPKGAKPCRAGARFSRRLLYTLSQHPIYGTISLIARIHGSRNQGVETAVAPLTVTPCDTLAQGLLPVPMTMCTIGLEVLVPKGVMLEPGDTTMTPLD